MPRNQASYRDPAGHVHHLAGGIFRSVLPPGEANYRAARDSGFLESAARDGRLIGGVEVDPAILRQEEANAVHVIEHPRLEFVSYPYCWSFYGLRAAALLTLDLHIDALEHGLTLSDASAFNVQFLGPKPVFIDYLSFMKYEDGHVWLGYRQFCEQFLNPLLLTAKTGVNFQPWFRGTLEGISTRDIAALLPFTAKLHPMVALHTTVQARMQQRVNAASTAKAQTVRLSKQALTNNLKSMRGLVAGLQPPRHQSTPWQAYEHTAHYTADERERKHAFVANAVRNAGARVVWDLGCNSGEYSELALRSGADSVIGLEPDAGALNAAFQRAERLQLNFLPLSMDLVNVSPSSGWLQQERPGLFERRNADLVLCLALIHHLVIGRNLPLEEVLTWLVSLAPHGVVEFVPKSDPMAAQLLTWKPHVAPDYELENVRSILARLARVNSEQVVTASGRTLFFYSRL